MIKKLLIALAASALVAAVLFGLTVFVVWDTDVEKWGSGLRAGLAWLWLVFSIIATAVATRDND